MLGNIKYKNYFKIVSNMSVFVLTLVYLSLEH